MSDRPWFRVRDSGLGWTPVTWQGWVIVLGSAAVLLGANLFFMAHLVSRPH
jgi:hypothetical protein